jgi:hypothetical protein
VVAVRRLQGRQAVQEKKQANFGSPVFLAIEMNEIQVTEKG